MRYLSSLLRRAAADESGDGMSSPGGRSANASRAGARRNFAPWADPAARPLVRFERVTKHFSGVSAVEDLTLDIFGGEFFALLGPSGCGKTTLLRMLAGFETPDAGPHPARRRRTWPACRRYRRPVNMMFQTYALFPHLTVAGNVAFGLQAGRAAAGRRSRRASTRCWRWCKLEALARRKPHQLSGGQRQRVALARALVKRPQRAAARRAAGGARQEAARGDAVRADGICRTSSASPSSIVTHDQEEAMTLADRIGVMNGGRLIQVAPPAEIYEQPNSRWVADFIGDVNLIEGASSRPDAATIRDRKRGRAATARRDADAAPTPGDDGLGRGAAGEAAYRRRARRRCERELRRRRRSATSAIWATCRSTRSGSTTA